MIKVERSDRPAILVTHATQWLDAVKNAMTATQKERALRRYNHTQIRAALEDMFHGKCAYCETRLLIGGYGRIEHYRPRSLFPEYTFEWENLLFSCEICNSTQFKGDHFPSPNEGGPLINPCDDEPAEHFTFSYEGGVASVYGKTTRGEISEKLLGLNRADLRVDRSGHMKKLIALKKLAEGAKPAQKAEAAAVLLNEAKQDSAEYAAFAQELL